MDEKNPTLAVVIPALNEEQAIGLVVAETMEAVGGRVIVVDNGSDDRTAAVAAEAGARVVVELRRGYGRACLAGVRAAGEVDVLAFLDGDFSDDPAWLPQVLASVLAGEADLGLARRLPVEPEALPAHQSWGNSLATWLIRRAYGVEVRDLGSMRAIRRRSLERLHMRHPTYGWPIEMVIKAARRGYRIREVPVPYRRRLGGSKVGGTLRGSLLAAYHMLAVSVRSAREPLLGEGWPE